MSDFRHADNPTPFSKIIGALPDDPPSAEQMSESRVVPANIGPIVRTCVRIDGTCEECGSRVIEIREHLTDDGCCVITELRRLAAEVERLWGEMEAAEQHVKVLRAEVERTTGPGSPSYRLNWLLDELGKRFPCIDNLSAEGPETQFVREVERMREERNTAEQQISGVLGDASAYYAAMVRAQDESLALRATRQAAAEAMREACIGAFKNTPPADVIAAIRALPLPTPDLDAIREAARREGAERALRWAFYEYHDGWMGSDAVVDAYVARGFATLFPAAPEAIANDS